MLARADVEDFLFFEASLLDEWKLDEWLGLWDAGGNYIVPSTDAPNGDFRDTLGFIADDFTLLRARVQQLMTGATWAEVPRSRTRRLIANVRILDSSPVEIITTSNFVVYRFRHDRMDTFVGKYEHDLIIEGTSVRIGRKKAILSNETLGVQGTVSIIL